MINDSTSSQPAIVTRALSKRYDADGLAVDALHGVDLVIEIGEIVAITGPSGSGKSTLLHLIGGLDVPTSGEVEIHGQTLSHLSADAVADARNRRIGFVFQLFNLLSSLSVEENVALPAIIAGRRPNTYDRRVDELLEKVSLTAKRHRFPAQLSGGEQQRVAIARALVMQPTVLLADEPTGNLDSRAGADILALLGQCHAEGQTVVIVTHDSRVAAMTERVVFLRDGEVVDDARLGQRGERDRALSRMIDVSDEDDSLLA
jgi:putative ABC transport system ATP-binding protein